MFSNLLTWSGLCLILVGLGLLLRRLLGPRAAMHFGLQILAIAHRVLG